MKAYLITFRSITYAQRGQQALDRAGIVCKIRRTPRWMEQRGCGYAVEARLPELSLGTGILNREGIGFRKAYRLNADGAVTEERL